MQRRLVIVAIAGSVAATPASAIESTLQQTIKQAEQANSAGIEAYRHHDYEQAEKAYQQALQILGEEKAASETRKSILSNLALLYSVEGKQADADKCKDELDKIDGAKATATSTSVPNEKRAEPDREPSKSTDSTEVIVPNVSAVELAKMGNAAYSEHSYHKAAVFLKAAYAKSGDSRTRFKMPY